jgi:hypothetical protein
MMLKRHQHGRIVKMANTLDIPVRYDREVEQYTLTPDQYERLLMLAVMADNVFEIKPPDQDEDGPENHR